MRTTSRNKTDYEKAIQKMYYALDQLLEVEALAVDLGKDSTFGKAIESIRELINCVDEKIEA